MQSFHLHLVSDATGETISTISRACLAQFETADPVEHVWSLVRTRGQLERVLAGIAAHPGVVLYTLVDPDLREMLQAGCREQQVPSIYVLEPVLGALSSYLGVETKGQPGSQHAMNADYFRRIDAIEYTLVHDDGQQLATLHMADVILAGVSRTSKTPTCLYLANRGVKAANVPLVPGVPPPAELLAVNGPLVVGLTKDPGRLVQIRRARLSQIGSLDADGENPYADLDQVKEEIQSARRLFNKHGWPVIDVSRRSIEETAAAIYQMLQRYRAAREDGSADELALQAGEGESLERSVPERETR